MTFESYVEQYEALVARLMSYAPDTIGHREMSSALADLEESNPEHAARYDSEEA